MNDIASKKICGNCKYRGGSEIDGFFLCELITMRPHRKTPKGARAYCIDGSDWYAALCVANDFGCSEWEEKDAHSETVNGMSL
jgi:hypothetical protein